MIAKRITRVTLTHTNKSTPGDRTHHPGDELWLVQWTITSSSGKTEQLRASSYTVESARQLAGNLVKQRPDNMSVEDVYSEFD